MSRGVDGLTLAERIAQDREWLTSLGDLPAADTIVAAIGSAIYALSDLGDRNDGIDFGASVDSELMNAAREQLQVSRRVVDMSVVALCQCWPGEGKQEAAAALRHIFETILNLTGLAATVEGDYVFDLAQMGPS